MMMRRALSAALCAALLLSGAAAQAGDRRGFSWSIGGSCGPAVPAGAALQLATYPPQATYPVSSGCCGGAPAMVAMQAPVQPVYTAPQIQTMQVQQMPLMALAPAPTYSGCCGGGAAVAYQVQYVPQVQTVAVQPPQAVQMMAEPPCGVSPLSQRLAVRLQQTAGCLPATREGYGLNEGAEAPMTNAELTKHVMELTAILDRVARLAADHEATLRKGSAQRPGPSQLPPSGP